MAARLAISIALLVALPSSAALDLPGAAVEPAPADPFGLTRSALDLWSRQAAGAPEAWLAQSAVSALQFAERVSGAKGDPSEVLRAVAPLLAAQREHVRQALGRAGSPMPPSTAGLDRLLGSVLDPDAAPLSDRDVLELAAALHPNPTPEVERTLDTARLALLQAETLTQLMDDPATTPGALDAAAIRAAATMARHAPYRDALGAAPAFDAPAALDVLADAFEAKPSSAWTDLDAFEVAANLSRLTSPKLEPTLETARQYLHYATALRALMDDPATTPEELTLAALEWQPRAPPRHPMPPTPTFTKLPDAVAGLYAWYEEPLPPGELERLATLPPRVAAGLTRIVEAHLLQAETTRIAIADANLELIDLGVEHVEADDLGVDIGLMMAARDEVARFVLEGIQDLACVPGGPTEYGSAVFQYDLRCEDSTYTNDARLLVDLGGNDAYHNNAGGASFGAAMLVDISGDDWYNGSRAGNGAVNGGASLGGSGFLLDQRGNDTYTGTIGNNGGVNGGAFEGSGVLLDQGGHDTYTGTIGGSGGVNGGAYTGSGFLLDQDGDDIYTGIIGYNGGVNGGAYTGSGFLLDQDGDDIYTGTIGGYGGVNGGANLGGSGFLLDQRGNDSFSGTVGNNGGVNGGAFEGSGVLLDQRGNDTYAGTIGGNGGVNGGAGLGGSGVLLDQDGDDIYTGTIGGSGGVNGGAYAGSGFLLDQAGDDTHTGTIGGSGGVNGGALEGSGFLLDQAGDDTHTGTIGGSGGVNGGASLGLGLLIDQEGTNLFQGTVLGAGGVNGAADGYASVFSTGLPVGSPGGVGILIAGRGDDSYISNGTTQGAGDLYGLGLLLDLGGNNSYRAGPNATGAGVAQGAGRAFGLGMLLDFGHHATFTLDGSTAGQGAGLQGIGLLIRDNQIGTTTYETTNGAQPSHATGAGLGLRLDLGEMRLLEPLDLTCRGSAELLNLRDPTASPAYDLHLCAPDDSTKQPIINPLTNQPLGPVPKPGFDCAGLHGPNFTAPLCPVGWPSLLEPHLGPDALPWFASTEINTTTSGGLALVYADRSASFEAKLTGRLIMQTADETCAPACYALTHLNP